MYNVKTTIFLGTSDIRVFIAPHDALRYLVLWNLCEISLSLLGTYEKHDDIKIGDSENSVTSLITLGIRVIRDKGY